MAGERVAYHIAHLMGFYGIFLYFCSQFFTRSLARWLYFFSETLWIVVRCHWHYSCCPSRVMEPSKGKKTTTINSNMRHRFGFYYFTPFVEALFGCDQWFLLIIRLKWHWIDHKMIEKWNAIDGTLLNLFCFGSLFRFYSIHFVFFLYYYYYYSSSSTVWPKL